MSNSMNHHGGTLLASAGVLGFTIFGDFATAPLWAAILICGKLDFVIDEIRSAAAAKRD